MPCVDSTDGTLVYRLTFDAVDLDLLVDREQAKCSLTFNFLVCNVGGSLRGRARKSGSSKQTKQYQPPFQVRAPHIAECPLSMSSKLSQNRWLRVEDFFYSLGDGERLLRCGRSIIFNGHPVL